EGGNRQRAAALLNGRRVVEEIDCDTLRRIARIDEAHETLKRRRARGIERVDIRRTGIRESAMPGQQQRRNDRENAHNHGELLFLSVKTPAPLTLRARKKLRVRV